MKTRKLSGQIVTALQLQSIYKAWGTSAEVPKAGMKSIVAWPGKEYAEVARIKKQADSDHQGPLFKIEFFEVLSC